jgi:predicted nucleic acid-binding protein
VISALVLDASVTLTWRFTEQSTPATDVLAQQCAQASLYVPALWFQEVANILLISERKFPQDAATNAEFLERLWTLQIQTDEEVSTLCWSHIYPLASKHRLTIYDATYLELAMRRALPLATLDKALAAAAAREGVKTLGI